MCFITCLESRELLSREIFLSRTKRMSCSQNRRNSGVDVYGAATSFIYDNMRLRYQCHTYVTLFGCAYGARVYVFSINRWDLTWPDLSYL